MAIDPNPAPPPARGRPFLLRLFLALLAFGACTAAGLVGAFCFVGACPHFQSHPERAVLAFGALGLGTAAGVAAGVLVFRARRRGRPS